MVADTKQSGYVAFITVLLIGAVAMATGLALLMAGTDSQRATRAEQQSKQARALAIACAQEALQEIHDNIAFSGTDNLTLGQGTCSATVTVTAPTTRTIVAEGLAGEMVRRIQVNVTIGSTTISVTSWKEVV